MYINTAVSNLEIFDRTWRCGHSSWCVDLLLWHSQLGHWKYPTFLMYRETVLFANYITL